MSDYRKLFQRWLKAANSYYFFSEDEGTEMCDAEWDGIADDLRRNWGSFDHPLKCKFEDEDGLKLNTAFHLTLEDYKNV